MRKATTLLFALVITACEPEATPTPTGPPQNIPATTVADAGTSTGTIQANSIELCSVEVIFNYTDQMVSFKNKNDRSARASVYRPDGTVIIENYLFADGEDSESASFAIGDTIEVVVEFLDLNLSLDQWKECARKKYILGR